MRLRYLFLIMLCSFSVACAQGKKVSILSYGAKADGLTDIRPALRAALAAADTVVIPKGNFVFTGQLKLTGLRKKTLVATGAVIKNTNNSVGTIFFDRCDDITLNGGTWARKTMPAQIGPSLQEHTFTFETCKNIRVEHIIINGSPQMGICIMNTIGAVITGNSIQNCFRDGVYAHYSAKLQYLNNKLNNIKDDALSIHDYGIAKEKGVLLRGGYSQGGEAVVSGNITTNTYQGFSSIGCANLQIINNRFSKTVNAGIAVFNSEHLFPGHTSAVKNVLIKNNTLTFNGADQNIMGVIYPNKGQLSSGRCALFVAVNDDNNYILHPLTRLSNITITNNTITDCAVNGTYLAQIDKLVMENNTFARCNLKKNVYATKTIEISACTSQTILKNTVR